jgi:hypothetical protein
MPEIRCDACGFIIGSLTVSAHSGSVETLSGTASNCKRPPITEFRSAKAARSKARAASQIQSR